jgi:hypothetical protein
MIRVMALASNQLELTVLSKLDIPRYTEVALKRL